MLSSLQSARPWMSVRFASLVTPSPFLSRYLLRVWLLCVMHCLAIGTLVILGIGPRPGISDYASSPDLRLRFFLGNEILAPLAETLILAV